MRKKELDRDFIIQKYRDEHLSTAKIAQIIGVNNITIHHRLHEWAISMRTPGGQPGPGADFKKVRNRDFVIGRYVAGWPISKIARDIGVASMTVWRWLRKWNVTLRKGGGQVGLNAGPRHGNWKGGRTTDGKGYVRILAKDNPRANENGYVREHILILEKTLGRHLRPGEMGHHLNGNRADNRPENLALCSDRAAHVLVHSGAIYLPV